MILVDTSSWIHFLRTSGDAEVRERVRAHLLSGDAAWCPIVRLELWNGARGQREKTILREFEEVLPELPITEAIWQAACKLAQTARSNGLTLPATDILIATCAGAHQARLEHSDSDFDLLAGLNSGSWL